MICRTILLAVLAVILAACGEGYKSAVPTEQKKATPAPPTVTAPAPSPPVVTPAPPGVPDGGDLRAAQRALRLLGHRDVVVDGTLGPKTAAALREYQRLAGLPVTGTLDAATRALLGRPGTPKGFATQ